MNFRLDRFANTLGYIKAGEMVAERQGRQDREARDRQLWEGALRSFYEQQALQDAERQRQEQSENAILPLLEQEDQARLLGARMQQPRAPVDFAALRAIGNRLGDGPYADLARASLRSLEQRFSAPGLQAGPQQIARPGAAFPGAESMWDAGVNTAPGASAGPSAGAAGPVMAPGAATLNLPGVGVVALRNPREADGFSELQRQAAGLKVEDPALQQRISEFQSRVAERPRGYTLSSARNELSQILAQLPARVSSDAIKQTGGAVRDAVKALTSKAAELPEDDPRREVIGRVLASAPAAVTDLATHDAATNFLTASRVLEAQLANVSGKRLRESQLQADVKRYGEDLSGFLSPKDGVPITAEAFGAALPELFQREVALSKTAAGRGLAMRLRPFAREVKRIEELNRLADDAEQGKRVPAIPTVSPEDGAPGEVTSEDFQKYADEYRQEAAALAEEVRGRITSGMSAKEETARLDRALRYVRDLSPMDASDPEKVKAIFESLGVAHLYTAGLGGGRLAKQYESLLNRIPTMAKLDGASQGAFLDELSSVARALGRRVQIPAQLVQQLSPNAAMRLAMDRERLDLAGSRYDLDRANYELRRWKQWSDIQRGGSGRGGGRGGGNAFTMYDREWVVGLRRKADQARRALDRYLEPRVKNDPAWETFPFESAEQDILSGKNTSPEHAQAVKLWRQWMDAESEADEALSSERPRSAPRDQGPQVPIEPPPGVPVPRGSAAPTAGLQSVNGPKWWYDAHQINPRSGTSPGTVTIYGVATALQQNNPNLSNEDAIKEAILRIRAAKGVK